MTFYRILQIGWLTAFWPITREPELCQIWGIGGERSTAILVSILDYFQEKRMRKIFKNPKNLISRAFWAIFAQIWAKMNFPGKKGSFSF